MHVKLPDGTVIMLKNATDRAIARILYMIAILDILDGMLIEVDIEQYIPNCRNCCLNKCNLTAYLKLAGDFVGNYYVDREGCVIENSKFDEKEKIVECGNFIRNRHPDVQEILETISVIPEIENL